MTTGRPRGSGSQIVRVAQKRVFIGRALWQAIGEPPYVAVGRNGKNQIVLTAADGLGEDRFRVVASSNSIPRFSIGAQSRARLGLREGAYQARVVDDHITLLMPRSAWWRQYYQQRRQQLRERQWRRYHAHHPDAPGRAMPGERNPRARLAATDIDIIRVRYAEGNTTVYLLAEEYGVSPQHISRIIRRQRWRE